MSSRVEGGATTTTDWTTVQEAIPTAHLVSSSNTSAADADDLTIPLARPTTTTVVRAPDVPVVRDAVAIPSGDDALNQNAAALDRALTKAGERKGRVMAEEEIERIQRASRDIGAINYYAKASVKEANVSAKKEVEAESRAKFQTASAKHDAALNKTDQIPPRKEPEFYAGTYGKDYEVSEYDTSAYDTRDYEVAKYKSVYESNN